MCDSSHTSAMVSMLGWFLYLTMIFKIGSLLLLAIGPLSACSGILRLFIIMEKKVFKTWGVSRLVGTISLWSINPLMPGGNKKVTHT